MPGLNSLHLALLAFDSFHIDDMTQVRSFELEQVAFLGFSLNTSSKDAIKHRVKNSHDIY